MFTITQDQLISMGLVGVVTYLSVTVTPFLRRGASATGSGSGADTHQEDAASQIYAEVDEYELDEMRAEYTCFGRFIHSALEEVSDDIQELVYVFQILRENQGLLILLVGGIFSMMCALVAGLENGLLSALCLSTALYGITTLIVARSARRIVIQNCQQDKPTLTKKEVFRLMDEIPKEKYVPDDDLCTTDMTTLEEMLSHRGQKCSIDHNRSKVKKEEVISQLRQTRRSHDCVICMSRFHRGETIRILPACHHEFHKACIDQWASTFASGNSRRLDAKRGNPTCPLCNTSCFAFPC